MQNDLKPLAGKMITDFPTAPLAPGLRGAGGGTVEKSLYASHTEILTLPPKKRNGILATRSTGRVRLHLNLGASTKSGAIQFATMAFMRSPWGRKKQI